MGDTTPQDRAIAALNDKFGCDNGAQDIGPQELRYLTATKSTGLGLADWQKLTLGEIVDCLADAGLLADPSKSETQPLSHVLLLKGVAGLLEQIDAQARLIRERDAELAGSQQVAGENQWLSEACRLTVREAASVRAERDRLLKDATRARQTLIDLIGGNWTVEPSLSELADYTARFWGDDRRKLAEQSGSELAQEERHG